MPNLKFIARNSDAQTHQQLFNINFISTPTPNTNSMRFKNSSSPLKVYAVTGTQTVLLAFDLPRPANQDQFLGFDLERTDAQGVVRKINGTKRFDSLINDITITDPKVKFTSLIQSFFWKDYTADPDQRYTYRVRAMFGIPGNYRTGYECKIKVQTEPLHKGRHSVYFNYGVTGSQAYARNREYGNKPIDQLTKPIRQKALDYLSRDLYHDGLITFLKQANTASHALYCAFYEIEYPEFLKELKAIKSKIGDLQIIYSGQAGQNKDLKDPQQERGNYNSLKAFGLLSVSHKRTVVSQPHNKFMVLCKDGKPIQVWTGSTNITLSGIFGQSNTGHWVKDAAIARKYFSYWNLLKGNPSKRAVSDLAETLQPTTDLTKLHAGTYAFFSPRNLPIATGTITPQLKSFVKLIDSARELVCMIFPFKYDAVFKKVFDQERNHLRLLLFEKASAAAEAKANEDSDHDLKVTAGAVLEDEVRNFISEVTPKTTVKGGVLFVHNKFLIIDPLGENAAVLTGSANFSHASVVNNDENMLFIKGDNRVADIYLTEFNRMFEHFWPRYLRKSKPKSESSFEKPLDESYTWYRDYYRKGSYHNKRGKLFINMQGAKAG
ncbi:MAG TPA: hypothetical protein DHV26_07745 [Cytophagales bacterium]|nr:hypothetical protein [Cytophagales bacterium]